MKRIFNFVVAITAGFALFPTLAKAGGDEVVVVYNSNVPESKTLADYYASRREVPRSQVWGFSMSKDEAISRAQFRGDIQLPLLDKLKSSGLWKFGDVKVPGTNGESILIEDKLVESGVRYAVLCYGVPLKVLPDPSLPAGGSAENLRPELRRNEAAVDTELAWLPVVYQHPSITGPMVNPVANATNGAAIHPTNGVLMVTRLDGPTPEIARGLVDKAIDAETDGMWGRAYFDLRSTSDPGLKPGDDWILKAAEICSLLGFETAIDTNSATFPAGYPMSQIAYYCGWYDANVSGPFTLPQVEFMPGAFAYHLHSFSAATIRSATANWVGPLLAKGATITMGCVAEPYLAGTPNVATFTERLVYEKFTFGEAAYASQPVISWQTTIVGDPLYHPFEKDPMLLHKELEAKHSKLIEWSYLRGLNLNLAKRVPIAQVASALSQIDATRQSAVLSEKLGDLCAAQGKPSSTIEQYEQALKLDPTREQRIRLRRKLGERLVNSGQEQEAYENYQKLLDEWPEYPGALNIYETLQFLAQKLNKSDDMAKWEEQIKRLKPAPPQPSTNASAPATAQ